MKRPSFQMYHRDWLGDSALSKCTPTSRGIWIDAICAMQEAGGVGALSGTIDQLARICRCNADEMYDAIVELRDTKTAEVSVTCNANVTVMSRQSNGVVTLMSRRINRESKDKEFLRLRMRKFREQKKEDVTQKKDECNVDVTVNVTPSSSCSSSTSENKEHSLEEKNKTKKEEILDTVLLGNRDECGLPVYFRPGDAMRLGREFVTQWPAEKRGDIEGFIGKFLESVNSQNDWNELKQASLNYFASKPGKFTKSAKNFLAEFKNWLEVEPEIQEGDILDAAAAAVDEIRRLKGLEV